MRLQTLVNLAKQFQWTTTPQLLHQTLEYGDGIEALFDQRVAELNGVLADEPCQHLSVVERPGWNGQLQRAACWKFPNYFHCLMLERPTHHSRCSVFCWTVRTAEMDILLDAVETRAERIRDTDTFRRHLDRTLTELAEVGFRQFPLKMALIDDLAAIPPVQSRSLLLDVLKHPDPEHRCNGCDLLVTLFGDAAIPDILPMANDPESGVGAHAVGLLNRAEAEAAVEPLARILATHSDVEIRAEAAHSLGGIGSPAAIPALLAAFESDHEQTALGHTPSSISADALDWLVRTRTDDGAGTPAARKPNAKRLKARARKLYDGWQANPGGE